MSSAKAPPPTFSALIAGPRPHQMKLKRLQKAQLEKLMKQTQKARLEADQARMRIPVPDHAEPKIDGRAYGSDYVGSFEHHTGTLGPFGFYANFYDEKK